MRVVNSYMDTCCELYNSHLTGAEQHLHILARSDSKRTTPSGDGGREGRRVGERWRERERERTWYAAVSVLFPNPSCSVGFRTTPRDSTGVSHILEHTTLCGSRGYPV